MSLRNARATMSQFRIGQSDFFSSQVTSPFVVGNLTVRRAPYLGGWPGHSSPLFRWRGTTFKISILCFIFCCLRRTIRIKSQALQPDGDFPQIDRWLSFNRRFFVGSLVFFFGNWFLLISRPLIKNRLPFRWQLLTRLLNRLLGGNWFLFIILILSIDGRLFIPSFLFICLF